MIITQVNHVYRSYVLEKIVILQKEVDYDCARSDGTCVYKYKMMLMEQTQFLNGVNRKGDKAWKE